MPPPLLFCYLPSTLSLVADFFNDFFPQVYSFTRASGFALPASHIDDSPKPDAKGLFKLSSQIDASSKSLLTNLHTTNPLPQF
jgi:hypothetical protein